MSVLDRELEAIGSIKLICWFCGQEKEALLGSKYSSSARICRDCAKLAVQQFEAMEVKAV